MSAGLRKRYRRFSVQPLAVIFRHFPLQIPTKFVAYDMSSKPNKQTAKVLSAFDVDAVRGLGKLGVDLCTILDGCAVWFETVLIFGGCWGSAMHRQGKTEQTGKSLPATKTNMGNQQGCSLFLHTPAPIPRS